MMVQAKEVIPMSYDHNKSIWRLGKMGCKAGWCNKTFYEISSDSHLPKKLYLLLSMKAL